MTKISLAMIVKNESDTIERVLSKAKIFCDEMIVVDTGSEDDTIRKAVSAGATVYRFDWIDDFSAARNFSFSHCTGDWIIWLDGDDIISDRDLIALQKLKQQGISEKYEAIYMRYVYPPFLQWRERLISRSAFGNKLRWTGPIHEYINGINADKAFFQEDIRIVHDTPPWRLMSKKDRNIRIIKRHFECGHRDERTVYLYAMECLHSFYRDEFEEIRDTFFNISKSQEYRYEIFIKMHDVYMYFSDTSKAVDALSRAIAEDPKRAEAYYKMGHYISNTLDQPSSAIPLFKLAASIPIPQNGTPELKCYSYGPMDGLSRAYFRLGDVGNARVFARNALRKNATDAIFLRGLAELKVNSSKKETLPSEWQEWISGNIARNVPRSTIIRILEENKFSPNQIVNYVL